MAHQLPALPFAEKALEPHISAETLGYHHGKHHAAYVANLNKLIEGTEYEPLALEEVIRKSDGGILNNAAQMMTPRWRCAWPTPERRWHRKLFSSTRSSTMTLIKPLSNSAALSKNMASYQQRFKGIWDEARG